MIIVNKTAEDTVKIATIETNNAPTAADFNPVLESISVPPVTEDEIIPRVTEHKTGTDIANVGIRSDKKLTIIFDVYGTLLADLRKRMRLTIFRKRQLAHSEVVDKLWYYRLDRILKLGIYPDFLPFKIEKYYDNPNKPELFVEMNNLEAYLTDRKEIPNLPWMKVANQETEAILQIDEEGEVIPVEDRYASIPVRKSFIFLDDWRIHMTLLCLKDHYH
jgi:hypothetical protein